MFTHEARVTTMVRPYCLSHIRFGVRLPSRLCFCLFSACPQTLEKCTQKSSWQHKRRKNCKKLVQVTNLTLKVPPICPSSIHLELQWGLRPSKKHQEQTRILPASRFAQNRIYITFGSCFCFADILVPCKPMREMLFSSASILSSR